MELLSRMSELENMVSNFGDRLASVEQSRAGTDVYGMVKLSDSSTVTESAGMAIPTREMNAALPGTLANKIQLLDRDKRISYDWGTPTPVTENIKEFSGQWQAYGGICTVYFQGVITMENVWELRDIMRDCPRMIFGYSPWGVAQQQESGKAYMIGAHREGVIHIRADGNPQTGWYRGCITYPRAI